MRSFLSFYYTRKCPLCQFTVPDILSVIMTTFSLYIKSLRRKPAFRFLKKLEGEFPLARIFLVGGAVRDIVLNRECKDYDFVVCNVPVKKLQKFLGTLGRVDLVGRRFGVLKCIPKDARKELAQGFLEPFDIALPRKEAHILGIGQYRDFHIYSDPAIPIEEDLARRDFTINAMALDVRTGIVIDPFGGFADLKKKIIRTVGNPEERFSEDYSRMLRALRFAVSFGFAIEEHTAQVLASSIHNLNREVDQPTAVRVVPYEVIAREILRTFIADPLRAFDMYDAFHVFDALMPDMIAMKGCPQPKEWHTEGDVWTHTRMAIRLLASKAFSRTCEKLTEFYPSVFCGITPTLIIALLLHDIGKPFTLKTPEKNGVDRVRFDGHDRVGADIARDTVKRLRLYTVSEIGVDPDVVHFLIKHHLLLLNSPEGLKNNTIERYFFKNQFVGVTLLQLMFLDAKASRKIDGTSSLNRYNAFCKRLRSFMQRGRARKTLPKPILRGDDIMDILSVPQSPFIGEVLLAVREEQLAGRMRTKKDARAFVRSRFKNLLPQVV